MKLSHQQINGFNVLSVQEERIDAHNSGQLKEYLFDMIEQGPVNVIVQLEQVRFIDSSGLGALLSGYKQTAAKSGKLCLANIQQQVLSMFELTRLNRVFEIYANVDEALNSQA